MEVVAGQAESLPERLQQRRMMHVEARVKGKWVKVGSNDDNRRRLIKFSFDQIKATGARFELKEACGAEHAKLFEVGCYEW